MLSKLRQGCHLLISWLKPSFNCTTYLPHEFKRHLRSLYLSGQTPEFDPQNMKNSEALSQDWLIAATALFPVSVALSGCGSIST